MPKKKSKSINKNGVTKRDSVYLTPVEEESEHSYKTGSLFGKALHNQDGYEYYSSAGCQNSSVLISGGSDQEEPEPAFEKRGVGLDFAILDSTFLLSQVFPTLFMGTVVQFAQSVTAYVAFSAFFGAIAIYLASRIVFDQKDLKSWGLGMKDSVMRNICSGSLDGTHQCTLSLMPCAKTLCPLLKAFSPLLHL